MRYPPATRSGLGMSSTRPVRVRCPPFSRRSAASTSPAPPPRRGQRHHRRYHRQYRGGLLRRTRRAVEAGTAVPPHPAGQRSTCLLQALRPQLKQKKTPVGTAPTGILSPPISGSFRKIGVAFFREKSYTIWHNLSIHRKPILSKDVHYQVGLLCAFLIVLVIFVFGKDR